MDHMQDDPFDEDFRTDGGEVRKQNKVDLPEAEKVDLAKVKFPGRRAVELPDAPTLDALQIGARANMPLPMDEMDAHLTTREDGAVMPPVDALSYLPGPQGRVSRIMRSNDELAIPESHMDLASIGTRKRDGLGLGDAGKNAVQGVL
jgi:hypothetical protein